jgi:[ribosomal protein S18]-alanine N-acetyltransferase
MTPEALAALHAVSFTDTPRPWTAAEFGQMLGEPTTLIAVRPEGFALGRIAATEAELLTLAVHPAARRCGNATALVVAFEMDAAERGATVVLLEVAVTNAGARALYARLGYAAAGRRPGYYVRPGALPVDALVLRKEITASNGKNHLTGSER